MDVDSQGSVSVHLEAKCSIGLVGTRVGSHAIFVMLGFDGLASGEIDMQKSAQVRVLIGGAVRNGNVDGANMSQPLCQRVEGLDSYSVSAYDREQVYSRQCKSILPL